MRDEVLALLAPNPRDSAYVAGIKEAFEQEIIRYRRASSVYERDYIKTWMYQHIMELRDIRDCK